MKGMLYNLALNYQSFEMADDAPKKVTGTDSAVNTLLEKVIGIVGGVGTSLFTLAVLVIACCIIFGSISPKNIGKWWTALFSCVAGAVVFFGVHLLQDTLVKLF